MCLLARLAVCVSHHITLCCWLTAGAREAVCRLLPLCLLHHSPEVRRPAAAAAKATLSASPGLMGALLAGLRHWANNTREALVLVVSTSEAGVARLCVCVLGAS